MYIRNVVAAVAAASFAAGAAAQTQPLGNGYVPTPLATINTGSTVGGSHDMQIVDMNDHGQVLVANYFIRQSGGLADHILRINLDFPEALDMGGAPRSVYRQTINGVTNRGSALSIASALRPDGLSLTYFFLSFEPVLTTLCWPMFPCNFQEYRIGHLAVLEPFAAAGDNHPELTSINPQTDEFAFAAKGQTEIFKGRGAQFASILPLSNVPAQFRGNGQFRGFADGMEGDGNSNTDSELRVFDDGDIGFVIYDQTLDVTNVLQVNIQGTVQHLYSIPGFRTVAINERRDVAYACDQCALGPGVYIQTPQGVRKIYAKDDPLILIVGVSLTDTGQVLIIEVAAAGSFFSVKLYDPINDRIVPIATNAEPPFAGDTSQFYTANALVSASLNAEGRIAIALAIPSNVSAGYEDREFIRFDPPGSSRENPILPGPPGECPDERFCFIIPPVACGVNPNGSPRACIRTIDPVVAVGYDYEAKNAATRFAGVELPLIGDGNFDLYTWDAGRGEYVDSGVDIAADTPYDFTANGFPNGIERFSIRGIETSANLDPDNPIAFVTTLAFTEVAEHALEMIPVRFDTDAVAPTVAITAPINGATLYADSFPASVNLAFDLGHDPLGSIKEASLDVNGARAARAVNPFTPGGGCDAGATAEFNSCAAAGATGTLGKQVVVPAPGVYEFRASARTDGGFGDDLSAATLARVSVEYPTPRSVANAYIKLRYGRMAPGCRHKIVSEIAARQRKTRAYGPRGGPYDTARIEADVDALKLQFGC